MTEETINEAVERIVIERDPETGQLSYQLQNLSHLGALAILEAAKMFNFEAMKREAGGFGDDESASP